MILIKNTQRKIKIDTIELKKNTQEILNSLGYPDYDISIWLTSNKTIHDYNRTYREKDKPTDILSFPYHTDLKAGKRIKPNCLEDKNLGDIIISPQYVLEDLERWNKTFEERMKILLVHGICHLLGYDHIIDTDYRVMAKKEKELLKLIE
ncbi:MAG: rRNA maturation RNase YbeY [Candidatus Babeliales bacterium]|nr:rRNA maturation RNase YbeY [Candidatus Babeliales bacterium]